MNRRDCIGAMVASAITASSPVAAAERPLPVVGVLGISTGSQMNSFIDALKTGLADGGYLDGRNVRMEYRWADSRIDRLAELANEFVARSVDVIVASGGGISAAAAAKATQKIPIVFTGVGNAVELGIVESLAKPGGNSTGVSVIADELNAKRLELLRELLPDAGHIGILLNAKNPSTVGQSARLRQSAQLLDVRISIRLAESEEQLADVFEAFRQDGIAGLVVGADPLFTGLRDRIVALAARHRLPAIYQWREFVQAGGLVSYGTNLHEAYRQSGRYVARILGGTKPGELPVMQPTVFELAVNISVAEGLGLKLPRSFQLRAIEISQ